MVANPQSLLNLAEIADGPVAFASQNDGLHLCVSSLQSDGRRRGRHPRNTSASRRTKKADESEKYKSSDGKLPKSPNQEEIMALLRRIRSSISKKKNAGESKEKSSTESILEFFRQSTKEARDGTTEKEGINVFQRKQKLPQKDKKTQAQPAQEMFSLTRPPSNFVKKSPIPQPSTPREKTIELKNCGASEAKASTKEMGLPRIEEMKLTELKQLAKSRGIKGYSKLRKSELLELLTT